MKFGVDLAQILFLCALTVSVMRVPGIWQEHSKANREAAIHWGNEQAAATRREVLHVLAYQLAEAQKAAEHRIAGIQRATVGELKAMRVQTLQRLDVAGPALLGEAQGLRSDLNQQAATLNASVSQVANLAPPIRNVVETFDRQFMQPIYVDGAGNKHGNPNTLWAGWAQIRGELVPTMDSFRRIADVAEARAPAVADAALATAEGVGKMAAAGGKLADEWTRPKRWYNHLWTGLKLGVRAVTF